MAERAALADHLRTGDHAQRRAVHIEEGYEEHGISRVRLIPSEAERRAWEPVNEQDHAGKISGSGVGSVKDRKGGRIRT